MIQTAAQTRLAIIFRACIARFFMIWHSWFNLSFFSAWRVLLMIAGLAALLSACQVSSLSKNPSSPATAQTPPSAPGPLDGDQKSDHAQEGLADQGESSNPLSQLGELDAQSLNPGQCGLFLWRRGLVKRLTFFSSNSPSKTLMHLDGQTVSFTLENAEGPTDYGIFTHQTFKGAGYNVILDIRIEARAGLNDGAIIPDGLLRLEAPDAWQAIIPIVGLFACQALSTP